jgi:hypothetical protein
MTIKSKKVRRAEITFGKVISAEKTGRRFYFSSFLVMCTKKSKKVGQFSLVKYGCEGIKKKRAVGVGACIVIVIVIGGLKSMGLTKNTSCVVL